MPASNVTYGLKDLPRGEYGAGFGVRAADIEAGVAIANIGTAGLTPSLIGLPVINKTGVTIAAGALVYVNSRDATSGLATVALADADAAGKRAQWIALAAILDGATATVGQQLTLTGQNTNAGNVGDPVYLSATAGAYTLTAPTAANALVQGVGNVTVKSATVGVVNLALFYNNVPLKLGANEYQTASIAGVALTANQQLDRQNVVFPTIPTTGAISARLIISKSGTIGGFKAVFNDGLVASNSNYITWTVTNLGQTSGGSTAMLAATAANTTQTTGGTAIVADTAWLYTVSGTGANMVVVAGDMLKITATVTGTLPNTVSGGTFSAANVPT